MLHSIVIGNAGSAETLTVYDNTSASGTKITTIPPVAGAIYVFDARFGTGLTIVTVGTTPGDYTATWL